MKQQVFASIAVVALTLGVFAFRATNEGTVTGKVRPAASVTNVWAVTGTDTTVTNLQDGIFSLSVKAGTYKVIVGAVSPYKDEVIENVQVGDGAPTDLGVINLKK